MKKLLNVVVMMFSFLVFAGPKETGALLNAVQVNSANKYQQGVLVGAGYGYQYNIGDYAQGGVVIWVTQDGLHGLVAAITDASGPSGVKWESATGTQPSNATNNDPLPSSTPSAPQAQYYSGYKNQQIILAKNNLTNFPAFKVAVDYRGGGYSDWFLPSSRELSLMYAAEGIINSVSVQHGGTEMNGKTNDTLKRYWSSRENVDFPSYAWVLVFAYGNLHLATKDFQFAVRCVRAF